jgi:ubiquinone/menaquinone biosynthesis C-methylase UbiE
MNVTDEDYLWEHLQEVPPFRALVRSVESQFYAQAGDFDSPALDLGCGDGQFAAVTFNQPFSAGIDPDPQSILEAKARNIHQRLIEGDATHLPFTDAEFAAVISNCVLEHITDIDAALNEVYRVLQPGGRFIFSVPSHLFGEMLLGSTILRIIHMNSAAKKYAVFFNRISKHYHTDSPETWIERMSTHGFNVISCSYYLSAKAHRAFDFAHYISIHSLLSKKLTGHWTALTPRFINKLYAKWLRPFYEATHSEPGPYLFFIVERDRL